MGTKQLVKMLSIAILHGYNPFSVCVCVCGFDRRDEKFRDLLLSLNSVILCTLIECARMYERERETDLPSFVAENLQKADVLSVQSMHEQLPSFVADESCLLTGDFSTRAR